MTLTRRLGGLSAYVRKAQQLSVHWNVPLPRTLYRLGLARLLHDRGFNEFDMLQFTTRPVRDWRHYVRKRELRALQLPFAPESARALDEDKVMFAAHCAAHHLPTVPVIATVRKTRTGGASVLAGSVEINSAEALQQLFEHVHDLRGFAKPLGGGQGYGAFSFEVRKAALVSREGATSVGQMFDTCAFGQYSERGYVLQPHVQPHDQLRAFMPGPGLGTVRICTFLMPDGEVCIPFALLKVPAPGNDSDNARWGSLLVEVDPASGQMRAAVGKVTEDGVTHSIARHPQTGAVFEGAVIPEWPAVLDLVNRAARAFSALPALGWDVAIAPQGPLLIETNWEFAGRLPEVSSRRGWAGDYRTLFTRLAQR